MYNTRPNLYIGFHGCGESTRDKLVKYPYDVEPSKKSHDWLGNGFYVWENNYSRALQWARDKERKGEIEKASVVGVIYTLSNCLDFTDSMYIDTISTYYYLFKNDLEELNKELPKNREHSKDEHNDKLIRELDCAVIEYYHQRQVEISLAEGAILKPCDSVRGIFTEGGEAYPGAGIQKKNHIQVCIRNFDMIKGFFIPKV